jgi:CheY-like chemotaxis protein/two-component sensor histidine kinase
MIGHELRNPLAPIVTALRIARERDPTFQKELIVIERQVAHLRQLVDDLLDVARIAHGKIDLKREVMDVAVMVASALELASPILEERAHHLELDIAPGLEIPGDPHRLAQVVTNLVVNAAKYTDGGGHIRVLARAEGDAFILKVQDDGIGMTPEVLGRVFDTFAQSRQSIDRSDGGLGLGLAIVKGIVDAHGGTVSASSDGPGCGSVLEVRLPAMRAMAASSVSGPPEPREMARPRRRVLVVDDNTDAADMVAEWLRRHGDDARVAYDGLSALAVAREFHPEVGFIDLGLPVMDGFELVGRIRAEPELAAMHLVAVTGYGQAADRSKSASAGFDAHLVKPVDLAVLQSVLDQLPSPPA